ncbi:MAG TPA: formate dehydrogenase subunit delta [Ideonella sp.]|nr:formate dehydrogenase subunit delta [Ideonella sp.]
MHHEQLVTMANQIGNFFRYQGDEEDAARNIARHLSHYWALRMRRDLAECLDGADGEGMDPLVRSAVSRYRDELTRYGAQVPGERALEQPEGGGDAG